MAKEEKVLKHVLVPEHIKLSEKEKQELFETHNLEFAQLPKILVGDAALVGLGANVMDVIKIVRNSPITGETVYYRGVVDE